MPNEWHKTLLHPLTNYSQVKRWDKTTVKNSAVYAQYSDNNSLHDICYIMINNRLKYVKSLLEYICTYLLFFRHVERNIQSDQECLVTTKQKEVGITAFLKRDQMNQK